MSRSMNPTQLLEMEGREQNLIGRATARLEMAAGATTEERASWLETRSIALSLLAIYSVLHRINDSINKLRS